MSALLFLEIRSIFAILILVIQSTEVQIVWHPYHVASLACVDSYCWSILRRIASAVVGFFVISSRFPSC